MLTEMWTVNSKYVILIIIIKVILLSRWNLKKFL